MITEVQKQIHAQVKQLLAEHFDTFVLVLETEIEQQIEGREASLWAGSYGGTNSGAVGLMVKYQQELVNQSLAGSIRDSS